MKAYQQELLNEYVALKKRELNLFNYLLKRHTGIKVSIQTCPIAVMEKQYNALKAYTDALRVRLECEGVNTSKVELD